MERFTASSTPNPPPSTKWEHGTYRRGSSLLDVVAACTILGVLVSLVIPLLSKTAHISHATQNREEALFVVSNLLERCHLLPVPDHDQIQPIAIELSSQSRLRDPQWTLDSTRDADNSLHRVVATLSWEDRPEVRRKVTLVRWYPGGAP